LSPRPDQLWSPPGRVSRG